MLPQTLFSHWGYCDDLLTALALTSLSSPLLPTLPSEWHVKMLNWSCRFSVWDHSMTLTSCWIKQKLLRMTYDALQIWSLPPQCSQLPPLPSILRITRSLPSTCFLTDQSFCTPSVSPVSSIHLLNLASHNTQFKHHFWKSILDSPEMFRVLSVWCLHSIRSR